LKKIVYLCTDLQLMSTDGAPLHMPHVTCIIYSSYIIFKGK